LSLASNDHVRAACLDALWIEDAQQFLVVEYARPGGEFAGAVQGEGAVEEAHRSRVLAAITQGGKRSAYGVQRGDATVNRVVGVETMVSFRQACMN